MGVSLGGDKGEGGGAGEDSSIKLVCMDVGFCCGMHGQLKSGCKRQKVHSMH